MKTLPNTLTRYTVTVKLDPKYCLVTGYPKAGNTWLAVMINHLVNPKEMTAGNARMPDTKIFTHCIPRFNHVTAKTMKIQVPGLLRNKNVVLLVRHPGDMLVSLYMHNVYREKVRLYNATLNDMVKDMRFGIEKILAYYQWWADNWNEPQSVCLLRYEDMLINPKKELSRAIQCLKIFATEVQVRNAVKFTTFRRMQNMEKTNHLGWPSLRASCTLHENGRKVRTGKAGSYLRLFNPETVAFIDQEVNRMPRRYRYP